MDKNRLIMETRFYKIRGLTPILGGQPASPAVRTEYISSRAPRPELAEEEDELMANLDDKGLTVFMRDANNRLLLMDYMIKGYFKSALGAIKMQTGIASERAKVDKYLFVTPRQIPICRDGEEIIDEDDQIERPLRAQTMRGERVTLAASEMINDPWEITIGITILPNAATTKSKPITWEAIEAALDYGQLCGIGQWRNGGYGRFIWTQIEQQ